MGLICQYRCESQCRQTAGLYIVQVHREDKMQAVVVNADFLRNNAELLSTGFIGKEKE